MNTPNINTTPNAKEKALSEIELGKLLEIAKKGDGEILFDGKTYVFTAELVNPNFVTAIMHLEDSTIGFSFNYVNKKLHPEENCTESSIKAFLQICEIKKDEENSSEKIGAATNEAHTKALEAVNDAPLLSETAMQRLADLCAHFDRSEKRRNGLCVVSYGEKLHLVSVNGSADSDFLGVTVTPVNDEADTLKAWVENFCFTIRGGVIARMDNVDEKGVEEFLNGWQEAY